MTIFRLPFTKSGACFALIIASTLQTVGVTAYAQSHPPNVLHITNVSKDRIDFEVKDGASWASGSYIIQSNFPMGNGVSAFFPLKVNQTAQSTYWIRYKKPNEGWSTPKQMKEINGSLNIPE